MKKQSLTNHKGILVQKYTRITFSTKAGGKSQELEKMIPAKFRSVLVLWHITSAESWEWIKDPKHLGYIPPQNWAQGGGFYWKTYADEKFAQVLAVEKVDGAHFTHKEVLDFLTRHPAPAGVTVMPQSDDEKLQVTMVYNLLNDLPWHHNLPK